MISSRENDRRTAANSLLGSPHKPLALRVRGSRYDGQTVCIEGNKGTIGSGQECDIRLCEDGIAPVHCLILRGEQGAVVRRWSNDTRLNGFSFDDAWLNAGDRVAVGPFEFEMLDSAHGAQPEGNEDDAPPSTPAGPDLTEWSTRLDAVETELAALDEQNDEQFAAERRQREQLREQSNAECQQFDDRLNGLAETIKQLSVAHHELNESASERIARLRADWEARVELLEARVEEADRVTPSDLEAIQRSLDESKQQLDSLLGRDELLDRKIEDVTARQDQLEQTLTSQHDQSDPALEQRLAQLEQSARELRELKAEFESLRARWQEETCARAAQPELSEPPMSELDAPVELSAPDPLDPPSQTMVLDNPAELPWRTVDTDSPCESQCHPEVGEPNRDGPEYSANDASPSDDSPAEIDLPAESAPQPIAFTEPGQPQDQQEESIEQYMARLLQRVSGDSSGAALKPAFTPQRPSVSTERGPTSMNASRAAEKAAAPKCDEPASEQGENYSPRTQAPEQSVRLAAMRELANQSTRQAIDTSTKRRKFSAAVSRLAMALVGLVIGAVLMLLSNGWGVVFCLSLAFLTAACGLAIHSLLVVRTKDGAAHSCSAFDNGGDTSSA